MQVTLDDNQVPAKSSPTKMSVPLQSSKEDNQTKATVARYSVGKKNKKKAGGVLFTSLRHQRNLDQDSTHFTDSTFNSAKRQQPSVRYTPCRDCSPQVQRHAMCHGTPRFCHLHLSPTDFKSVTRKKKRTKIRPKSSPTHSPKPAKKKKKQVPLQQKKSKQNKDDDDDGKERDYVVDLVDRICSEDEPEMSAADVSSAIASQANQLQELRREISQKLADLKSGRDSGETERNARLSSIMGANLPSNASDLNFPDPGLPSDPRLTSDPGLLSDPRLPSMLRRLEELEVEENAIRQRWNTISYEDPVVSRSEVTHHKGGEQYTVTVQDLEQGASPPLLSSESLANIEQYRQRYKQHLNTTQHSTVQGGFDPWKMAERYELGRVS